LAGFFVSASVAFVTLSSKHPSISEDAFPPRRKDGPMLHRFTAALVGRGPNGAWVFLPIPLDVPTVFGTKARVAVKGTMNGAPFRNSLLPNGDTTHSMAVNKELLASAKAGVGDSVEVVLSLDTERREVSVPEDLQSALSASSGIEQAFGQLAYSYQKEFVEWITSAKKPETRVKRIDKTLELLGAGKRLKP
jgi:Bacteriocin-protection, YdeI or OmpD-Associated/Domain of unknown function (DUF1905)